MHGLTPLVSLRIRERPEQAKPRTRKLKEKLLRTKVINLASMMIE